MKISPHEQAVLVHKRGGSKKTESLAALAAIANMPTNTLKSRVKKLVDQGIDRDKAVELSLLRPIAPQGRPRRDV